MEKATTTKIRVKDLYPGEGLEWVVWRKVKTAQSFRDGTRRSKRSQSEIIEMVAETEGLAVNQCSDLFNQAEKKFTEIKTAYAKAKLELRQEVTTHKYGHYSPQEENLIQLTMMVYWDRSVLDNVKTLLRLMPHRTKDGIRNQMYIISRKMEQPDKIIAAVKTKNGKIIVDAEVMKLFDYGVVIRLADGERGFIHISNIINARVDAIEDYFYPGQWIKAVELAPDSKGRRQFSTKEIDSAKYMNPEERKMKVSVTTAPLWNPEYAELYAEQHRQYEQDQKELEQKEKMQLEPAPVKEERPSIEILAEGEEVVDIMKNDLVTEIYDNINIANERLEAVKEMLITLMDNVDELVKKGVKEELERMAKQYK